MRIFWALIVSSGLVGLLALQSCRSDMISGANAALSGSGRESSGPSVWGFRSADRRYLLTLQRVAGVPDEGTLPSVQGTLIDFRQNLNALYVSLSDTVGSGEWVGEVELGSRELLSISLELGPDLQIGSTVKGAIGGERMSFGVSPLPVRVLERTRVDYEVLAGDSVNGSYALSVVQLKETTAAAKRINDSLWAGAGMVPPVPSGAVHVLDDTLAAWSAAHDAMLAELLAERGLDDEELGYGYNEAIDHTQRVLVADDTLLTVSALDYMYSGGAHGNYGTSYLSFDRRSGAVVRFDSISLSVQQRERLKTALDGAARSYLGLPPGSALSEALFVETVPLTVNAGRVPGGWVFGYVPYEIGPYAVGQLELLVWDGAWQ